MGDDTVLSGAAPEPPAVMSVPLTALDRGKAVIGDRCSYGAHPVNHPSEREFWSVDRAENPKIDMILGFLSGNAPTLVL